jgi:ATP-grasp domain
LHPSVLIVAAKWWPLSARVGAELARQGCRVSALCPAGHPLTHVRTLEHIERYRGVRSLSCLSRTIKSLRPDIVIPCDDGVVAQLHALHESDPSLRAVIEASLGDPSSYPIVRSRRQLLEAAVALGIPVPETRRVRGAEDLAFWHQQIAEVAVLKVDGESGGNGVRICKSLADSLAAWREFKAPQSSAAGWKRLAVDRDPVALWLCKHHRGPEITVQRAIYGQPANIMAVCRDGKVLAQVSVVVLASEGLTGAARIIWRVKEPRMAQAAALLAKRLKLTGFFGLDFMIETDTGVPHLIEMNPRCTQLGHLEFPDQGSLAGALSAEWRGAVAPAADNPILLDTIALFPQALNALPAGSRRLDGAYLDVPRDQPELVAELKLEPWPQRRWLARLYHTARPIERIPSVEYEVSVAPHSQPHHAAPRVASAR